MHWRLKKIPRIQKKYKDMRWRRLRLTALQRDKYLCTECKRYGRTTPATMVHHINPSDASRFLDLANLTSLCDACHNGMHNRMNGHLSAAGTALLRRTERHIN